MKHKKRYSDLSVCLLVLALLFSAASAAEAQSAWEWETSLQVDRLGDSMYMPSAVAFDKVTERYYAVDTGRNRLVSFDRDGKLVSAFTANEQLKAPFDMVRLDNGQLWVVEKGRNSLTLIDVAAQTIKPHLLKDGDRSVFPDRIAVSSGKLYVLDRASGQILRLADDLSVEQHYRCAKCSAGMTDFIVRGDEILALEPRAKKIYRFRSDGTITEEIPLGDELDFPVSLEAGPTGSFYVLDRHKDRVMVYSERGLFRYSFLGSGQAPGEVYFSRQVRFDPWGRLCIVDEGNGRIEIYSQ